MGKNKKLAALVVGAALMLTGCSTSALPSGLSQADKAMHNCTTVIGAMDREFTNMQPVDFCDEYRELWSAADFDNLWITDLDRLLKNHEVSRDEVELYTE